MKTLVTFAIFAKVCYSCYRSFSHDVTAVVFVNKKNPVGIELFSHVIKIKLSFIPSNLQSR